MGVSKAKNMQRNKQHSSRDQRKQRKICPEALILLSLLRSQEPYSSSSSSLPCCSDYVCQYPQNGGCPSGPDHITNLNRSQRALTGKARCQGNPTPTTVLQPSFSSLILENRSCWPHRDLLANPVLFMHCLLSHVL